VPTLLHAIGSVKVLASRFPRWCGRSRVLTVMVGMVLAVGVLASPAAAVTASITLKPSSGPPTTKVSVTGTGFGASETVAVDFSGTQVATAATSATGTFSATFTVPKSALPGSHPVTATGQPSGRSATKNFLVRANWAKFHFDPANSGLNPYENVIGPASVSGLKTAWTTNVTSAVGNSPAVANGVVYVGSVQGKLYAFSAAGTTGCSGTPKTCTPLWTGAIGGGGQIDFSSPAVAGGVVYVAATDGNLYAFSAAGTTGCSGTPKTCVPLWTAAIAGGGTVGQSSPVVAGGVVYVSAGGTLYAFSAAGTTGCSGTPKTCTSLWTAASVNGESSPAVAGGVVYVGAFNAVAAFSAAGTTGCSGTPPARTCTPLWTGDASTGSTGGSSSPAVAGGVVYIGSTDGDLYAFSAGGTTGCSCTPKTCAPLWTGPTTNQILSSPAVAHGVAYIGSLDGKFYAFSATGTTGCSGTPKTCAPLWTAAGAGGNPSPAVANGLVYAASGGQIYAFSAAGTTGCSGTPKTCTPLWTGTSPSNTTYASPAVANGMVYEGQWNLEGLLAYKLP